MQNGCFFFVGHGTFGTPPYVRENLWVENSFCIKSNDNLVVINWIMTFNRFLREKFIVPISILRLVMIYHILNISFMKRQEQDWSENKSRTTHKIKFIVRVIDFYNVPLWACSPSLFFTQRLDKVEKCSVVKFFSILRNLCFNLIINYKIKTSTKFSLQWVKRTRKI